MRNRGQIRNLTQLLKSAIQETLFSISSSSFRKISLNLCTSDLNFGPRSRSEVKNMTVYSILARQNFLYRNFGFFSSAHGNPLGFNSQHTTSIHPVIRLKSRTYIACDFRVVISAPDVNPLGFNSQYTTLRHPVIRLEGSTYVPCDFTVASSVPNVNPLVVNSQYTTLRHPVIRLESFTHVPCNLTVSSSDPDVNPLGSSSNIPHRDTL